jgi:hypothetical protein
MAEIKSTLDLVMERTRNMRPSREEREEMLAREREKKAKGLLLRLSEGHLRPENLHEAAAEAAGPEETEALEAELRRLLVQDLSLDQDPGPAVAGLEALAGQAAVEPFQALLALQKEYRNDLAELDAQAAAQALQDLADRGLTGSALRPKPDRTPGFEEERLDLRRRAGRRFEQVRRNLAEAVGPAQS